MTLPLALSWWRGLDLNQRPPGYEPDQLQPLMPSLNKLTFCYLLTVQHALNIAQETIDYCFLVVA